MRLMRISRRPLQFGTGSRRHCALGRWVVGALAAALVLMVAGLGPTKDALGSGNLAPVGGPNFRWSAQASSTTIELGESFDLSFLVHNVSYDSDHGGMSVSFPDLTRSGARSTSYSSSQGTVRTVDYTTGRSNVSYFDRGDQIWNSRDQQQSAEHLLVESDDPSWPTTADRILRLEVTPKQAGRFRVYYRFWVCGDDYSDCSRAPTGRDIYGLDQQGWAAGAFNIQVEESNSPPSVSAVSPLQSLRIDVGDSVTFRARATDEDDNISRVDWYVNRSRESGQSLSQTGRIERSYTHRFSSGGTHRIEVEFTDTEGESDSVVWDLYAIEPPSVDSLGCNDSRVQVGETVRCSPRLSGGSPTSYLWGSIGGNPWSGTNRSYSTSWDSPGQKRIVFEACNNDGCDSGEHNVVVDPRPLNPPRIDRLGCDDSRVEVGETVSCSPRVSGGSPTSYLWGSIGGDPWSGTSRSFSTSWDTPGQKRIVFEACNNDGCDSGEHNVVVDPRPLNPPRIDRLGCDDSQVQVGETVSCSPRLSGGNPTRYLWGSIDGDPWSGTNRSFSTRWNSPGQKRIVFEACNNYGCNIGEHWVDVIARPARPPVVNSLGCSDSRVEVGETVSCGPSLSGGNPTSFLWGSIDGNPWNGTSRSFSTRWNSPGQKKIVFEACNNDGCDSGEHNVEVVQRAARPPVVSGLGCSDTRVNVGETVRCSPNIGGGTPTRYLWGSREGSPWSGTSRAFSTHWDSPGRKQIVFEACNNDGCDTSEHWVEVEQRADPLPIINTLSCNSSNVATGETVSCSALLGGGSPSRYQWNARGGSPSSGSSLSFSTHWDSQGTKQISLEVCNDGGCATSQLSVSVDREISASLSVTPSRPVYAGESIQVSGSGFRYFSTIGSVRIGGRAVVLHGISATDGAGRFTTRVTVPALPQGKHDLVVDVKGQVARASIQIETEPQPKRPPRVSAVSPSASLQLEVGSTQQFTAEATDPDNDLIKVEWFINGAMEDSEPIRVSGTARKSWSYRVPSSGNYRVTAKFTDAADLNDSVEWRFEGMTTAQLYPPAPRIEDIGCSPTTVSVGESVTCSPEVSGGDGSRYEWIAVGGVSRSGSQRTFSTSWSSAGRKEIEFETCNRLGSCDRSGETITVEDVFYIGAQDTYQGEFSFTGDQQLLKVFVSAGRRLRLELTEPSVADFAFNVSLENFDGEIARTWSLNSPNGPKSMEIRTPEAGWYVIRIVSKRGSGKYEFRTRTDEAYIDLVIDRGALGNVDVLSVITRKVNCKGTYRLISERSFVGRNENLETHRFFITEETPGGFPDCMFEFDDGSWWTISFESHLELTYNNPFDIGRYMLDRYEWVHGSTIYLTYDDVHWSDSTDRMRLNEGVYLHMCIPSCGPLTNDEIFLEVLRFLFFDDVKSLSSTDDSSVTEKWVARAFLLSSFVPAGKAAKSSKVSKFLKAAPKQTTENSESYLNWIRKKNLGDLDPDIRVALKKLEFTVTGVAVGDTIPKLTTYSVNKLLTPSDFAKVSTRFDGKSAGEAFTAISDKLNRGQALTPGERGLYSELQVAAAAKQLGLTLPNNWLRRQIGPSSRIITDLDVLARLPTGELIAFDSKGHWRQYASGLEPAGSKLRFISNADDYRRSHIKARITLALAAAKRQGAQALVIVTKGLPEKKIKTWLREQGIVYARLPELPE